MRSEIEDHYAATVDVARTASGTGRFAAVLEISPTIFEFTRPNGVVYRVSIANTLTEPKRYWSVVDATSQPAGRWKRTDYVGKGSSPSEALQSAIAMIEIDQAPFGDD